MVLPALLEKRDDGLINAFKLLAHFLELTPAKLGIGLINPFGHAVSGFVLKCSASTH